MKIFRFFFSKRFLFIFGSSLGVALACFLTFMLGVTIYEEYSGRSFLRRPGIWQVSKNDPLITIVEMEDLVSSSESIVESIQNAINTQGAEAKKNQVKGIIIVL
ncbi:hypothetical protein JG731_03810 [Chlamydia gallinacea]|nr:hypothetical protein [Chlamydia gallinacea]MBX6680471.1 hypothetical protein [Chlamydia gallinacea]